MREDIAISKTKFNILKWLCYYRGLTPEHIAKLIYKTKSVTISKTKSIYNQLKKLEDLGLVKRHSPHPRISAQSIYYLSPKGLDFVQFKLELWEGSREDGWVTFYNINYGYFNYDTYKPPLKQIKHHLFLIDLLIICLFNDITHRNNLYSSRISKNRDLLRPDAEMKINEKNYLIEVDTGTENHLQFIEKFNKYFNYIASNRDNNMQDIDVIVIIMDTKHSENLNRRWQSILAAFHIAMRRIYHLVELVLITKEDFEKYISLEVIKHLLIHKVVDYISKSIEIRNPSLISYDNYYQLKFENKLINFTHSTTKYSSKFVDLTPPISFIGYYTDKKPFITPNFSMYRDVPSEIINKYNQLQLQMHFIPLK